MTRARIAVVVALVGATSCSNDGLNVKSRSDGGAGGSGDAQGAGTCAYGGRTYAVDEKFKNDCNTCTCTTTGIECTLAACLGDAGFCVVSASLTFGYDGGEVLHVDVNRLEGNTFSITRTYSVWTGVDAPTPKTCSPTLPACGTANAVTVATINADLADPDVQAVWTLPQDPVPLFGTDPRPMDGTVYSIALADGRKVLVGGQCASPMMSSCRYIPAGLVRLTQDLQKMAAAMVADPACASL